MPGDICLTKTLALYTWGLRQLGIIDEGIPWLVSSKYAFAAILIFSIWKFTGTAFLYFIAGLGNVPESYYEAARIDGANERQVFFKNNIAINNSFTVLCFFDYHYMGGSVL